jgi:hypothetical protein
VVVGTTGLLAYPASDDALARNGALRRADVDGTADGAKAAAVEVGYEVGTLEIGRPRATRRGERPNGQPPAQQVVQLKTLGGGGSGGNGLATVVTVVVAVVVVVVVVFTFCGIGSGHGGGSGGQSPREVTAPVFELSNGVVDGSGEGVASTADGIDLVDDAGSDVADTIDVRVARCVGPPKRGRERRGAGLATNPGSGRALLAARPMEAVWCSKSILSLRVGMAMSRTAATTVLTTTLPFESVVVRDTVVKWQRSPAQAALMAWEGTGTMAVILAWDMNTSFVVDRVSFLATTRLAGSSKRL